MRRLLIELVISGYTAAALILGEKVCFDDESCRVLGFMDDALPSQSL